MRRVFRGRSAVRPPADLRRLAWGAVLLASLLAPAGAGAQPEAGLAVRITSPLGRTGVPGTTRIVARVSGVPAETPLVVRFFVDGVFLADDEDGAPYAAEWVDTNPFERREIAVEAWHGFDGSSARDAIVLEPFEIVDEAQVSSVLLEAAVLTPAGRFVTGLGLEDFHVEEDGRPQAIQFASQEDVPATFALLVDSSQSMARRIDFVQYSAGRLLQFLRPVDRVMVAPFTGALHAVTGPTDDRATVIDAIGAIRPGGGTAILDALVQAADRLAGTEGRRALILITDGYDENSEATLDRALNALLGRQITTYVVAIGGVAGISLRGERLLRRLAEETGGRAFFPMRETDLGAVYDVLAADAQNRYLLAYTPENQTADGAWRAVALTTRSPEHVVRTRAGYFAPAPPPVRPSIEFTVTDADQQYVDVTADDLLVVEDGVEQRVESFQEAVTPVSVVLALDASGSMRRSAEAVVSAARSFVASLRPQDRLALVLFADGTSFAHDLSTDRDATLEAIGAYVASGGTALYDALSDSLIRLRRVEGRRAVVVLTDGRDEDNPGTGPGSVSTFDQVLDLARETGAVIFPIGLGASVDRSPLDRLAAISGGQAYYPADVAGLGEQYARVVENLRRRFVVSYTSTNGARDGSWRSVEIRTRSTGLTAASAGGYFAPAR